MKENKDSKPMQLEQQKAESLVKTDSPDDFSYEGQNQARNSSKRPNRNR